MCTHYLTPLLFRCLDAKVIDSRVDGVLHLLGLQHCKDTTVGDFMHRGVSGGEKRRTTIIIAFVLTVG